MGPGKQDPSSQGEFQGNLSALTEDNIVPMNKLQLTAHRHPPTCVTSSISKYTNAPTCHPKPANTGTSPILLSKHKYVPARMLQFIEHLLSSGGFFVRQPIRCPGEPGRSVQPRVGGQGRLPGRAELCLVLKEEKEFAWKAGETSDSFIRFGFKLYLCL